LANIQSGRSTPTLNGAPQIGYVSVAELVTLRGPMGLHVERDLNFSASRSLAGYATEARLAGRIRARRRIRLPDLFPSALAEYRPPMNPQDQRSHPTP